MAKNQNLPLLKAAIQRAAVFSDGEVENAIRMQRTHRGKPYLGCEAVVEFGGAEKVILHALRCRHLHKRRTSKKAA